RTDAPASPPGNSPSLRSAPGAALDAPCPGYGFTAVCKTSPDRCASIASGNVPFPTPTAGAR
ncbi:hypothetical protein PTQ47_25125, partial [Klebsiella michiganensis]|uniref:hypothetical protein n=1 Tax=Klebsiella michiganensis TaxID=1134687 RepID=UPI00287E1580